MPQDKLVDIAKLPARLDAQFLGQRAARVAVDGKGVRLTPAPVQRQYQLRTKPLPQRVLAHERLQLTGQLRVAAQGQVSVDPVREGGDPLLVQPGDRDLRERLIADVGEGRATPHLQRAAQRARGVSGFVAGQLGAAGLHQRLEPVGIDPAGRQLQGVSAGHAGDHLRSRPGQRAGTCQRAPEPGDSQLESVARIPGPPVPPERLRGHVGGHDVIAAGEQQRQQHQRAPAGDLEPRAGCRACLDRAEQADVDVLGGQRNRSRRDGEAGPRQPPGQTER